MTALAVITASGVALGAVIGFGACALLFAAWELFSARVQRFVQRGDYRNPSSPFRIVSRGPAPHQERSETLIAREARRLMERGAARRLRAQ